MREETERILIAGVLFNTGDPDKLNEKYFTYYPKTLEESKKARNLDGLVNPLKVARTDCEVTISDLSALKQDYFPYMFEPAYKEYLEDVFRSFGREFANEKVKLLPERMKAWMDTYSEMMLLEPDVEREGNIVSEYWDEIGRRGNEKLQMLYGIPSIDRSTGGLQRNELIVVGARPSVGKSAFALQVAENVAKIAKVLFVSCEMSRHQIMDRRILRNTAIDYIHLKSGKLSQSDSVEMSLAMDNLNKNIIFLDKTYTLNGIKSAVAKYKPDLLVIDYITLLRNGKHASRREEIASITRELKLMSLSGNMAIMGLAQINRGGAASPMLQDFKESGTLEEDSDVAIILHRISEEDANYFEIQNRTGGTPIQISIDKNRNGITGRTMVGYFGERYTFKEPYREG